MSLLRIKVVYEDDIRMLKIKKEELVLSKITNFVKEAHKLEEFRLLFKDDEGDEITIVDDDDLKEALSSSNGKTTKIYVKTPSKDKKQEEEKETTTINDDDEQEQEEEEYGEEDNEESDDEDYETGGNNNCSSKLKSCGEYLKFLDDISEDEELKKEFISFLTTFILSLQEEQQGETNGTQLFIQALSLHPKLNKHEIVNKFVSEKLEILFNSFPHLLNILKQINVNELTKFIDLILDFNNNNKNSPRSNHFPMLPPFLFPFMALFNGGKQPGCGNNNNNTNNKNNQQTNIPPFCGLGPSFMSMFGGGRGRHHYGRHGHHGHHGRHGRRGHHHGHHGFGFGSFGRRCGQNNMFRKGNNGFKKHCNERFKKNKDLRADIIDENITLGKDAFVNGNQTLIKTWKMKNVGKKPIPENCSLQYFGRRFNPMIDGTKFEMKNKEIQINEEFEVSCAVKSPQQNGKYVSKWKLVTKDGKKFGQALIVSFIVSDDIKNDENNRNNKLKKQLSKEETKLLKKEEKLNKKQQKQEEKIIKKKEKLRYQREKLLKKLEQLEQQSNELQDNIQEDDNDNDKDDEKEFNSNDIIIEEQQNEQQQQQGNNSNNIDPEEDDIVIVKETEEDNDKEDDFEYSEQLKQLTSMGFNDIEQLKQLLTINKGNIQQVINQMMN